MARAAAFSEEDLAFQVRLIERALSARRPVAAVRPASSQPAAAATLAAEALDAARQLGESIERGAICKDGSAAWVAPVQLDHDHATLTVAGLDLYSGSTGIALFLAALAEATRSGRIRDLAAAAAAPVERIFGGSDGGARLARVIGIGAGGGIGSLIYALVHLAELLHDPRLLARAGHIATLIDSRLVAADRAHDAISGAAGAIVGLLALHRESGEPAVLQRAVMCGQHLLRRRVVGTAGDTAWRTYPGQDVLPTGMAHGVAGIALALLRLSGQTGDDAYRAAARDALLYERRQFVPESGNWPSRTDGDGGTLFCRWCYGAPGIGLARLAMLELTEDPKVPAEIDAAVRTTLDAPEAPFDHLCCGNFGRIEFLLTAGRRLGRAELIAAALRRTEALLASRRSRGGFALPGDDDTFNPGFFQGISGIGYALLRIARPDAFPNVLLWE